MKVYKFTVNAPYSGGCIIIAANNEGEAITILEKEEDFLYNWFDEPIELTKLTTNVDTPQVLVNEFYIE